jgi:hypothetical protein
LSVEAVREDALAASQPHRDGEILAAIRNSGLLFAVQDGLRRIGAPPARTVPPSEAMARLVGLENLSDHPARLLSALRDPTGRRNPSEAEEVTALRLGLARCEVPIRYQPIVRIVDRKPVSVEGLVRWLRPDGRRGSMAAEPVSLVMMAERGGLAYARARTVGRLAVTEMKALRPCLSVPVSINLPLQVLLGRDTVAWLGTRRPLGRAEG